jgi:hypothetical protein
LQCHMAAVRRHLFSYSHIYITLGELLMTRHTVPECAR